MTNDVLFKSVSVSPEFYEIERLRERTRHNEASALAHAAEVAAKAAKEERDAEITKRLQELGISPNFIEKVFMD
jgi:hypothetical protein